MENSIADYLTKLDEADAQAASQRETVQLKSKLAWLEKRLIELQQIKAICILGLEVTISANLEKHLFCAFCGKSAMI